MDTNGSKTAKVSRCPNCKTQEPTSRVFVDVEDLGRVFIDFLCCDLIWITSLLSVGNLISHFNIPNPKFNNDT